MVYEDDLSIPTKAFAFGVALTSLNIQTCASDWETKFVSEDEPGDVMHKLVSIEGLSVHFDADVQDRKSVSAHVAEGKDRQAFESWSECVLQPLDISVRMRTHKLGAAPDGTPGTSVHLIMNALNLRLSNEGLISMIRLMGLLTDKQRWANYLQFRPQVRPGNARAEGGAKAATIVAWWKYALRGVLHDVRKSRPAGTDRAGLWKLASELILARSRYVKLYKRRTQLTGRGAFF